MLPFMAQPLGASPSTIFHRFSRYAQAGSASPFQLPGAAPFFAAVRLRPSFVKTYFTGTHTQVEGVGLREIARETVERHQAAFGNVPVLAVALEVGGEYAFRLRGEAHMWRPSVVADLQHAVRGTKVEDAMAGKLPPKWRDYARQGNGQSEPLSTMRGPFPNKGPGQTHTIPESLDIEPKLKALKESDPTVAELLQQIEQHVSCTRPQYPVRHLFEEVQ